MNQWLVASGSWLEEGTPEFFFTTEARRTRR